MELDLKLAMEKMRMKDQLVARLIYRGMSQTEIGKLLQKSQQAISSQLKKMKKYLKDWL